MQKKSGFKKFSIDIEKNIKFKNKLNGILTDIKNHKETMYLLKNFFNDVSDQIIQNNLIPILLFKQDLVFCQHCSGFEKCNKKIFDFYISHYKLVPKKNITKDNNCYLTCVLEPCELKIKELKLDIPYTFKQFGHLNPFRDFPSVWHYSKIDKLDKSKVRLLLMKEYKKILDGQKKWLFITGSRRSGKSFIAATFLNDLISKKKQKAMFLNCIDRIGYLKDIFYDNKIEFNDLINLYSSVNFLVLDNFGEEYKNEFIRDNIVFKILNERIKRNLITIFTSNFSYDELSKMYSFSNFKNVYGEQLKKNLFNFAGDAIDISTVKIY